MFSAFSRRCSSTRRAFPSAAAKTFGFMGVAAVGFTSTAFFMHKTNPNQLSIDSRGKNQLDNSCFLEAAQELISFLRTTKQQPTGFSFRTAACAAAKFTAGKRIEGLPEFTDEDVAKHNKRPSSAKAGKKKVGKEEGAPQQRVWVVYKAGVYDITDFIETHPGGAKRILLAAGGSIEPFWRQFTIHANEEVHKQLEEMRIGNLKGYDASKHTNDAHNNDANAMWKDEPKRHPALEVRTDRPFNAETPAEALTDSPTISNPLFFVRNHLPVPVVENVNGEQPQKKPFCLEVSGEGIRADCLTLDSLRHRYGQRSVTTTIQCGGNRRADSALKHPEEKVKGLTWGGGAIGTAEWTGAYLRDLLLDATPSVFEDGPARLVEKEARLEALAKAGYHVKFEGADGDASSTFEVSVPLAMAIDPKRDVLVAWGMNGEAIPRDHGFPLRAIVPGTVGVRNCKWLRKLTVSREESQSDWQQRDYKYFPSWLKAPEPGLPSIYDVPTQSVITEASRIDETVTLKGYAFVGGGRGVQRVEVSCDGGKSFSASAELSDGGIQQEAGKRWAWQLFKAEVDLPPTLHEKAKATDDPSFDMCVRALSMTNDFQPEVAPYNFRGLMYNGYHCVSV